MAYSNKVIEHFESPKNVGSLDKNDINVGTGLVGAPACGDVLKLQIMVNENGIIEDARFKAFGCGSAIASSSLVSEMIKGMSLEQAAEVKNSQIAEELNLPPVKIHCSVLAEDSVKAAIEDYRKKQKEKTITREEFKNNSAEIIKSVSNSDSIVVVDELGKPHLTISGQAEELK